MYHQKGVSADGLPAIDVLHIFGRTNNTPHVYYYRRCIDKTRWTAWEKVDVDIEGNHLIPVIWNRRLYLFWAIFSEKQEEQSVTVPSAGETMPSGKKYWGIQLAWSEYKNKRWSAKKLSDAHESARDAKLTDKNLFYFRTEITHDNILIIHCKDENSGSLSVTTPANSNGLSIDVRLYANFTFIGCNSTPLITSGSTLPVSFKVPRGTGIEGMMLSSSSEPNLYLPASKADTPVLNSIDKESTRLLIPHQDKRFSTQRPLFFQDYRRTFLIIPEYVPAKLAANELQLGSIQSITKNHSSEFSKSLQSSITSLNSFASNQTSFDTSNTSASTTQW